jgi:hypothetical protein
MESKAWSAEVIAASIPISSFKLLMMIDTRGADEPGTPAAALELDAQVDIKSIHA